MEVMNSHTLPEIIREDDLSKSLHNSFLAPTWHSMCYEYPVEKDEAVSKNKFVAKFESVARMIHEQVSRQ
jgi:hypothetical protein